MRPILPAILKQRSWRRLLQAVAVADASAIPQDDLLLDLKPQGGITTDQTGNWTLSNAGSLAVFTDSVRANNPQSAIQFDGSGELETTNGTPIEDFDTAAPFTVYVAYRLSELDSGAAGFFATFVNNTSNYACFNSIGGDELRIRVTSSAGTGVKDTSFDIPGQSIYILSATWYSTSESRLRVDGTDYGLQTMTSTRDPGTFLKLVIGASASLGNELQGEMFRLAVYDGDVRNDVFAALTSQYTPSYIPASGLTTAGSGEWEWGPTLTGDYVNARAADGAKHWGSVINGYGGIGTTDGISHLKPTAASDEMILFDYSGTAGIELVGEPAPQRILLMVAFVPSGTGSQDLMALGTDVAGTSRVWISYDADTGLATIGYKDNAAASHTLESSSGIVLGSNAVVIGAEFAQTGGGTVTQLIVGIPGAGTSTYNGSVLGDLDMTKVVLGGQYSAQTTGTCDAALLRAVVIESESYSEALALEFLDTVRGSYATSTLTYGGANADDLIAWWSAEQPEVSHEGNNYPVVEVGTMSSGTYGGRDYADFPTDNDGYTMNISTQMLAPDESLVVFTLFYTTTVQSCVLGRLAGNQTSDRPLLYGEINTSGWLFARVYGETGTLTSDQKNPSGYSTSTVHVAMARVTKATDGNSYDVEVGVDGTWEGSPTTRAANDLETYPFTHVQIGNPGFTNNPVGVRIFDVLVFKDTGVAINASSIATYLDGLIVP